MLKKVTNGFCTLAERMALNRLYKSFVIFIQTFTKNLFTYFKKVL
ncbi:hypothetical protein ACWI_19810 [Acetobacterium wieringae]|uniref:Uncharacterized protein n=1 Tax=Acetobacterium wieringae TaxID=52694 RepID=A0A1F2PI05_9FIRM|nr:hypothetical protein ACWI_19810 [Acetobacterium wieringae]